MGNDVAVKDGVLTIKENPWASLEDCECFEIELAFSERKTAEIK